MIVVVILSVFSVWVLGFLWFVMWCLGWDFFWVLWVLCLWLCLFLLNFIVCCCVWRCNFFLLILWDSDFWIDWEMFNVLLCGVCLVGLFWLVEMYWGRLMLCVWFCWIDWLVVCVCGLWVVVLIVKCWWILCVILIVVLVVLMCICWMMFLWGCYFLRLCLFYRVSGLCGDWWCWIWIMWVGLLFEIEEWG